MSGSQSEDGPTTAKRRRLRQILTCKAGGRREEVYAALQDEGYETIRDIQNANPLELKNIDGVGDGSLRRLTKEVEGFDASDHIYVPQNWSERESAEVTHCPACRKELEDGEYLDHILNCDKA